ncbi:Agglutinin-1 [Glycine soja]|uniref:Agglutinin-1 n=1 Tax=Glycine soja TaxID=3848 RepID=A0A0B2PM24_GLYSO|nr:lectin CPL-like [Glycine soja]KAG4991701.1 hypothetical protein JHK87_025158 [Glycine soja]KAG5013079.1 hypothetical protein JHK86_025340 [Glycine max]KAH1043104.1 hypothetical protein GYH30_025109 [Glycine max]KHN10471.1 Agglutinin-1 [Glycine soja]
MAIWKTNKSLSLPLMAFTMATMFLMLLNRVNSADSLSFSFNNFSEDQEDLILQGDATTGASSENDKNVLQLTKLDDSGKPEFGSVGRVLYFAPVHLWKSSQLVSTFETTFTFKISSASPDSVPADGLAFFIASPDTTPGAGGQDLGLFPHLTSLKNSSSSHHRKVTRITGVKDLASEPVVAVEFDTFINTDIGDPEYQHIGIDINSITSVTTTKWDWQNGKTVTAQISYNSASKRLTVVASYPDSTPVSLYYDIDLFTILPEWVRVGFSASTGGAAEANTLLSWSFSSSLQTNQIQKEDMHGIVM